MQLKFLPESSCPILYKGSFIFKNSLLFVIQLSRFVSVCRESRWAHQNLSGIVPVLSNWLISAQDYHAFSFRPLELFQCQLDSLITLPTFWSVISFLAHFMISKYKMHREQYVDSGCNNTMTWNYDNPYRIQNSIRYSKQEALLTWQQISTLKTSVLLLVVIIFSRPKTKV